VWYFLAGLMVGVPVGMLVICMLTAGKRADECAGCEAQRLDRDSRESDAKSAECGQAGAVGQG
jgi:hypothetical protein